MPQANIGNMPAIKIHHGDGGQSIVQNEPFGLNPDHSYHSYHSDNSTEIGHYADDTGSSLGANVEANDHAVLVGNEHNKKHVTFTPRTHSPVAHTGTGLSKYSTGSIDEIWARQCVLCLDGGGVRGYSTLLILKRLMEKIIEIEKNHEMPAQSSYDVHVPSEHQNMTQTTLNATENYESDGVSVLSGEERKGVFLPCHYFDYMIGTSTGGLIAILLSRLQLPIDEAIEAYDRFAGEVFGRPRIFSMRGPLPWFTPKHSARRFEKVLKEIIKEKTTREPSNQQVRNEVYSVDPTFNSEPTMCKTVCIAYGNTGVAVNLPTLFRSYEQIHPLNDNLTRNNWIRNPGPAHAISIWKIARATSAAPTYFKKMKIEETEFIDGALGSNNPALEAYHEVRNMHNSNPSSFDIFLSIGTGQTEAHPSSHNGIGSYIRTLFNNILDVNRTDDIVEAIAQDNDFTYRRFNVENHDLRAKVKLDEWKKATKWSASTKDIIIKPTNDYIGDSTSQVEDQLQEAADRLVKSRRERSATPRWDMAMGIRYRCTVAKCHNGQKIRNTRKDLIRHITSIHPELEPEEVDYHVTQGRLRR